MRITKKQLRRIIKEEKARLLKEAIPADNFSTPDRSLDDDIKDAAAQIGGTLFDVLEEMGHGAQVAREIAHALKTTAYLDNALDQAINDYLKKLKMMGGMPKPRSV